MPLTWPSQQASPRGLLEVALAGVALLIGRRWAQRAALDHGVPIEGLVMLLISGVALFLIARRREYPWLLAFAAIALPLYDPASAPYLVLDRIAMAVRDVVLVGAAALFILSTIRRGDELERRIQLEALAWSYAFVLLALVGLASVHDVLPPIRGTWVASAMLGSWVAAWLIASFRYQR